MQVNQAFFEGNGQCGFILKPLAIHDESKKSSQPLILKVKIISAQQLPKARGGISNTVIDPSIDVEIIGMSSDNAKFRTRAISSNGFNPVWKEEFTFKVGLPEMAFLRFQVQDSSSPIGSFSVHLPNLEQGFRHVPLYDWKGHLMRFSSLFVFIQKQVSVS
jgi:phosphatidylinositol phospholipase C delta